MYIVHVDVHVHVHGNYCIIMKSVDSISRDGPDTPIYIIHYKSEISRST